MCKKIMKEMKMVEANWFNQDEETIELMKVNEREKRK